MIVYRLISPGHLAALLRRSFRYIGPTRTQATWRAASRALGSAARQGERKAAG
jgi:hypothetical protein